MDIPIDAEVVCRDGPAGRTSAVIVDPVARRVTHVVVRERAFPHTEFLAPLDLVTGATPQTVQLRCPRAELLDLAPLRRTDYVVNDEPFGAYLPSEYLTWPYVEPMSMAVPITYEQVPQGELAVHRGAHVIARDGHVGRVDEFLVDPRSGQITHLVLREGHLWSRREVTVPLRAIDHIDEDQVYLNLDRHALAVLSAVPIRRQRA